MLKVGDKVESIPVPEAGVGVVTEVCKDGDIRVTFPTWYGKCGERESTLRLVQSAGPVVTETVTKTRIVPGVYAGVHVGDPTDTTVAIRLPSRMTADELDAAAAVLSALAKGLRDA
jgi:hypothetical protein